MGAIGDLFRKHTIGGKLGLFGKEDKKRRPRLSAQSAERARKRRRLAENRASGVISRPLGAPSSPRSGVQTLLGPRI